jgi:putative FmdB family regulatory protein
LPTYIYECQPCNKVFSQNRPITERDLPTICKKCHTPTRKRLFTTPILIKSESFRPAAPQNSIPPRLRSARPNGLGRTRQIVVVNNDTGIKFSGSGTYDLPKDLQIIAIGNKTAIDIDDDVEVHDYNTHIE